MNELIQTIFQGFTVDGVSIPVKYMFYEEHGEPYITYQEVDADNPLDADDDLWLYVDYYDFDVYSKGNYLEIVEKVKEKLKENDFVWIPGNSSSDMYETETGYYHKTLNFAHVRKENNNG